MDRLSVSQPRGFRTRGHCAPPPTRSPAPAEARPHPALHSRSLNLGLALPGVAAVPERHRVGETGHRGSMAPTRLSALLALALEIWTALSRARGARADPEDEQGQPALGCAAHPRRSSAPPETTSRSAVRYTSGPHIPPPTPVCGELLIFDTNQQFATDRFSSDSLCSIARQRVPLSAVVECETLSRIRATRPAARGCYRLHLNT
jgi:hypothetical protein